LSAGDAPVSVVLVTWNSLKWLPGCFGSLESQTCGATEIVVVDNGSTDGGVEWIREHCPRARIIENAENRGFCVANNQGIAASTREHVLLLNTDVELAPDFVAILLEELDEDPKLGIVSGKLLRGPAPTDGSARIIDSAGEVFYKTLRMVNRGEEEIDRGQFDEREEVFGVTAAAAIYRRKMLEEIRLGDDYLDSDYFAYLEDSDLNWRARLRGWRCVYQPRAVADHIRQHATCRSAFIQRHAHANRYLSILKNESLWNLVVLAPHLLVYEAHRTLKTLFLRPSLLPAYGKVLRLLGRTLRKRRRIQRTRKVSSREAREWMIGERYGREILHRFFRRSCPPRPEDSVNARAALASEETRRDRVCS
jgi:GT2 family glycosyltransferase